MQKLQEVPVLLRQNGLRVHQAKRLLHLLRGITGFRASPAEFAHRVTRATVEVHGSAELKKRMQPLVDDIQAAVALFP